MSKRSAFLGKDILRSLLKKGFQESNTHHKMLYLIVDGKKTAIRTRVSHGRTTYEGDLWSALARQLCLTNRKDDLHALIECSLGYDAYCAILKEDGHL